MTMHARYGLTEVINAAGPFTPLGVSRSSHAVGAAVAEALSRSFVMEELQAAANLALRRFTGAEAGTVVHCAAAGLTLSIAGVMTAGRPELVAALPDTRGMAKHVVLPAGHVVNYGQSILQAIRLAGATPIVAGTEEACAIDALEAALAGPKRACLLLVASRLTRGPAIDLAEAVAAAHRLGLPTIIDGAAQDLRIAPLLATGTDLLVLSAQKYLAAPTAGLVIGGAAPVAAVRAQETGIGRAMKATKEAISGMLAAIEEREALDLAAWSRRQEAKVAAFVRRAASLHGIDARLQRDRDGLPIARAHLRVDPDRAGSDAAALAEALKASTPAIWPMRHGLSEGELIFELVPVDAAEVEVILSRLAALLSER